MAKPTLQEAIQELLSRCDGAFSQDGVGFNKFDAQFVRECNWQNPSPKLAAALYKMLRKYQKQLLNYGIDYSEISPPKPSTSKPKEKETPAYDYDAIVTSDAQYIYVKIQWGCKQFDTIKSIVKERLHARWEGSPEKRWRIYYNKLPAVIKYLKDLPNIKWDPSLLIEYEYEKWKAQRDIEASRAQDADIVIDGLGGELMPFQRAGVKYVLQKKKALIADEMGLGKTVQALAVIQALQAYPALIICPASLKINWKREAQKWLPGKKVSIINGNSNDFHADVVIINYDILKKYKEVLLSIKWGIIIVDESHYIKNYKAQRTELVKEIGKKIPYKLLLTGTPLLNRPKELISQLSFLGRLNDFGGFWTFVKRYCNARRTQWGWDMNGAANLEELNQKLRASCMVRRRKEDVLKELPTKRRVPVVLPISNREEYEETLSSFINWIRDRMERDRKFQEKLQKAKSEEERERLREQYLENVNSKAENVEQLTRIEALKQICVKGKMTAAIEWIRSFIEQEEKLVIFATHHHVIDQLYEEFRDVAVKLVGGSNQRQRQEAIDRFQNDSNVKLFIGNIKAAGVGITLTAASNVAFLEFGWTPSEHDQAEDRVHRIGQDESVTAWYLVADETIDEEILALIDEKRKNVTAATDGIEVEETKLLTALIDKLLERSCYE